jgi:hypothetical protein
MFSSVGVRSSSQLVNAVTVNISRGRSTQARQRIGTRSTQEYKRSAGEELSQFDLNKSKSVITNCKFRLSIYPINQALNPEPTNY